MGERILTGGLLNQVVQAGNTVRRPVKRWSATIHKLLLHLESVGFTAAPRFLGIDEQQREILSFCPGETGHAFPVLPPYMWSDAVLTGAARMLRAFHDASQAFAYSAADEWMLTYTGEERVEVICHNDMAPYNVVFNQGLPVSMIDLDTACPGPRIWDMAYTAYTFVPLGQLTPSADGTLTPYTAEQDAATRQRRLALFFQAYGIEPPPNFSEQVVRRLEALCQTIVTGAAAGDSGFAAMCQAGHVAHYQQEIEWIKRYGKAWLRL